eukprot:3544904-Amphidinium_carterae.1
MSNSVKSVLVRRFGMWRCGVREQNGPEAKNVERTLRKGWTSCAYIHMAMWFELELYGCGYQK